jgi:hypothetical protein
MNVPTEADDLVPVIHPFGRRGDKIRFTDMTGRQREAALRFFPRRPSGTLGRVPARGVAAVPSRGWAAE